MKHPRLHTMIHRIASSGSRLGSSCVSTLSISRRAARRRHQQLKSQRGFTIVELLIVIVVIGILATLTIIAYNGVQGRAQAAAVSSSLDQTNRKLALYAVDNSAYPPDLATAGVNNSGGTSYQYSFNNAVSPQTYCVTATDGTTSYKASSAAPAPTSGGCPGHGVGGVGAVTNMITNPSFETSLSGWYMQLQGSDTATSSTTQAYKGSYSLALTVASSAVDTYVETYPALQPGTYTVSGYVYLPNNGATFVNRDALFYNAGGLSSVPNIVVYDRSKLLQWQRVSATFTTTTAGTLGVRFYGPVGTTYVDSVMVNQASPVSNYADGNSPNWVWNGTLNLSTSTGPAQ